jgi:hypothetical protein
LITAHMFGVSCYVRTWAVVQFQRWISPTIDNWQRRIGVIESASNEQVLQFPLGHPCGGPTLRGSLKIGSRRSDRRFFARHEGEKTHVSNSNRTTNPGVCFL